MRQAETRSSSERTILPRSNYIPYSNSLVLNEHSILCERRDAVPLLIGASVQRTKNAGGEELSHDPAEVDVGGKNRTD